jgi:hypothetical protein
MMENETLADLAELVGLAKRLESIAIDAISGGWWLSEREIAVVHSIARDIEEVINR